jgi:hypothetical protein
MRIFRMRRTLALALLLGALSSVGLVGCGDAGKTDTPVAPAGGAPAGGDAGKPADGGAPPAPAK